MFRGECIRDEYFMVLGSLTEEKILIPSPPESPLSQIRGLKIFPSNLPPYSLQSSHPGQEKWIENDTCGSCTFPPPGLSLAAGKHSPKGGHDLAQ